MSALRQLLRAEARHELVDADLLWSTVEASVEVPRVEAPPSRSLPTG